jgi:heme/copper-type cytochrome/quinol oxidase subunit 2
MFLGRIVRATAHTKASIVRPTWLTKIFLGGDILCFLVQAVGAAMLAKTDATQSMRDLGKYVVLAGLIIQLFVFGFFIVVAVVFHLRARKAEGSKGASQTFNWQRYLFMLYAVSGLITVRNVFRVAEYAGGGAYS